MTKIFKVVAMSNPQPVSRQDGTQTQKATIVLQELGGKYEDSYAATLLGNMASLKFHQNDLVVAVLRFQHREYNSQFYMDCTVKDIAKLSTTNAF